MLRLLKSDLFRITKSRNFLVILLLIIALSAFIIFTNSPVFVGVTSNTDVTLTESPKNGALEALITSTSTIPFFLYFSIVIYTTIISQEFSQKSYKNILFSGISRTSFIISKILAIIILLFITLCWFHMFSLIFGYIQFGIIKPFTIEFIKNFATAFIHSLVVITTYFSIGLLLQLIFNNSIISIIFVLISSTLIQLLIFFTNFKELASLDLNSITSVALSGQLNATKLITYISVDLIIIIVITFICSYIMKKREF